MRIGLIITLSLLGMALAVQGAEAQTLGSPSPAALCRSTAPFGDLHLENDSFGGGTDEAYTQGLEFRGSSRRLLWQRGMLAVLNKRWQRGADDPAEDTCGFTLGQTIYTPSNLLTYRPSRRDRPYGALLYYTSELTRVRRAPTENLKPRMLSAFATLGVSGELALGRDIQSGFHLGNGQRIVKGWYNPQLSNRFEVAVGMTDLWMPVLCGYNDARRGCTGPEWLGRYFDVTVGDELLLGTTQSYAGVNGALRLGRGLSVFSPHLIRHGLMGGNQKAVEVSVEIGGRARAIAHNAFVTGPLFGERSGLALNRGVLEWHWGMGLRVKQTSVSLRMVSRASEFRPRPSETGAWHKFSMLDVSTPPPDGDGRSAHLGLRAGLNFGRSKSSTVPESPSDRRWMLGAGRYVEWSVPRLFGFRGLTVGIERNGTARESGRPQQGRHSDLLLLADTASLGYERQWTPNNVFQIRGGYGRGQARHVSTEDVGAILEPEAKIWSDKGRATTVALRYSRRLGGLISMIAEGVHARMLVDGPKTEKAHFTSVNVGFQIHPFGRDTTRPD